MSGGFRVDDSVLAEQAATVAGLAARVRAVADAAQPLRLDAYGLVGRYFAGSVAETSRTVSPAVADVAEVVRRHGEGVRASHEDYRAVDHAVAAVFGMIG